MASGASSGVLVEGELSSSTHQTHVSFRGRSDFFLFLFFFFLTHKCVVRINDKLVRVTGGLSPRWSIRVEELRDKVSFKAVIGALGRQRGLPAAAAAVSSER